MSRADLDKILPSLFKFAQTMLNDVGSFLPFGAAVTAEGEVKQVGGYTGDEHPPAQEIINLLTSAFQQDASAGTIRAAGICFDVLAAPPGKSEKTDAICARLEDIDGEAVEVFLPYRKGLFGRMKYGSVWASPGKAAIFVRA